MEYFDQISIINLPYRRDRQKEMIHELDNVQMELVSGHIDFFEACRPEDKGKFPNIGARGCFMSHLAVLKKAQQDGVSRLLVMEDDLALEKCWSSKSRELVVELEETDWDILYFGHELNLEQFSGKNFCEFNSNIPLTHFFAVHSRVIPRLVNFLELVASREAGDPEGGPMHVDGAISTFRLQNPDVKTIVASPSLGAQRASKTDIHTLSWFDRLPVIKTCVGILRKVKNQLN
ncbi:hypothetical protein A9Q78_10535 [Methylophaga sp. 41_12_T18]|nr:hypothetical protein A9Q78_10535 [Methylophaga sp. 41_12_T18]